MAAFWLVLMAHHHLPSNDNVERVVLLVCILTSKHHQYCYDRLLRRETYILHLVSQFLQELIAELGKHSALLEVVTLDLKNQLVLQGAVKLIKHLIDVLFLCAALFLVDVLQV
jgi:hypothetical protein